MTDATVTYEVLTYVAVGAFIAGGAVMFLLFVGFGDFKLPHVSHLRSVEGDAERQPPAAPGLRRDRTSLDAAVRIVPFNGPFNGRKH